VLILNALLLETLYAPPNNPLQRSVMDKVLGRGRGRAVAGQVCAARVLERPRAAAERGRYAPL
jgi:hypothetical protein